MSIIRVQVVHALCTSCTKAINNLYKATIPNVDTLIISRLTKYHPPKSVGNYLKMYSDV